MQGVACPSSVFHVSDVPFTPGFGKHLHLMGSVDIFLHANTAAVCRFVAPSFCKIELRDLSCEIWVWDFEFGVGLDLIFGIDFAIVFGIVFWFRVLV